MQEVVRYDLRNWNRSGPTLRRKLSNVTGL